MRLLSRPIFGTTTCSILARVFHQRSSPAYRSSRRQQWIRTRYPPLFLSWDENKVCVSLRKLLEQTPSWCSKAVKLTGRPASPLFDFDPPHRTSEIVKLTLRHSFRSSAVAAAVSGAALWISLATLVRAEDIVEFL